MTAALTLIAIIALAIGVSFRVRHIERQAGRGHQRGLSPNRVPTVPSHTRARAEGWGRSAAFPLPRTPFARARAACPLGFEGDDCCRACAIEPAHGGGV